MTTPRISLCQLSFPDTTLVEDIAIARGLGVAGISLGEAKLGPGDDHRKRRLIEEGGLAVPFAIPSTWTILPPLGGTFPADPAEPEARVALIAAAVERFGRLGVPSVMVCTGPAGDRSEDEAHRIVVEALRHLAKVALGAGTALSIEPMRESFRPIRTIVSSLEETVDLLEAVDDHSVGIVFDIWHMWDSPALEETVGDLVSRFHAVQVADYRAPTRGPLDRVLPGDGVADVSRVLRLLRSAGFEGWYDLEVFSDDGRYGSRYEDSLWKLEPEELARRLVDGFRRCWQIAERG